MFLLALSRRHLHFLSTLRLCLHTRAPGPYWSPSPLESLARCAASFRTPASPQPSSCRSPSPTPTPARLLLWPPPRVPSPTRLSLRPASRPPGTFSVLRLEAANPKACRRWPGGEHGEVGQVRVWGGWLTSRGSVLVPTSVRGGSAGRRTDSCRHGRWASSRAGVCDKLVSLEGAATADRRCEGCLPAVISPSDLLTRNLDFR